VVSCNALASVRLPESTKLRALSPEPGFHPFGRQGQGLVCASEIAGGDYQRILCDPAMFTATDLAERLSCATEGRGPIRNFVCGPYFDR
jgi:hypothetical protein